MAATLKVKTSGFEALTKRVFGFVRRARELPRSRVLSTPDAVAGVNQAGAIQRGGRAMQRAIAARTGAAPPSIATLAAGLVHPKRPIRITAPAAARVALSAARHIVTGAKRSDEEAIRADVAEQFEVGGKPRWVPGKDYGRFRAARPTLGGSSGRVAQAWAGATFREVR